MEERARRGPLQEYGKHCRPTMLDQGCPEADSSATGVGEWETMRRLFPDADVRPEEAALAEMDAEAPMLPRARRGRHETMLLRSLQQRVRARRAAAATRQAAAAAAAMTVSQALLVAVKAARAAYTAVAEFRRRELEAARRAEQAARHEQQGTQRLRRGGGARQTELVGGSDARHAEDRVAGAAHQGMGKGGRVEARRDGHLRVWAAAPAGSTAGVAGGAPECAGGARLRAAEVRLHGTAESGRSAPVWRG